MTSLPCLSSSYAPRLDDRRRRAGRRRQPQRQARRGAAQLQAAAAGLADRGSSACRRPFGLEAESDRHRYRRAREVRCGVPSADRGGIRAQPSNRARRSLTVAGHGPPSGTADVDILLGRRAQPDAQVRARAGGSTARRKAKASSAAGWPGAVMMIASRVRAINQIA